MSTFPKLKTDAVAQYPALRRVRCANQTVRFLDGTEQRYRDSEGPLHEWEIRLDQLDEAELTAVAAFFEDNGGEFGHFAFTDPWDGTVYANCSLAGDEFDLTLAAEMRGSARLTVMENRG